jgi:hypothetical protein
MQTTTLLVLLSAFAGAVHVMAPDHWVPASIHAWQRRWSIPRAIAFSVSVLTLHVLFGIGMYFALGDWLRALRPQQLFPFAIAVVLLMMAVRAIRYSRIQDVQRLGPHSHWGILAVVMLLGPCESILPVFIKASSLGVGYLLPLGAFLAGTVVTGSVLVVSGRLAWNRPFWITRFFDRFNQRVALLPVAAACVLGMRLLLRLN